MHFSKIRLGLDFHVEAAPNVRIVASDGTKAVQLKTIRIKQFYVGHGIL